MVRPLKILVADDVDHVRQLVTKFLQQIGHSTVFAADGVQAVEMFRQEQPDMVIMDVMMPNLGGFEATEHIRRLCGDKWVPIIFLTALDQTESVVTGLEAGGDDYLTKPVNLQVLRAKIAAIQRSLEFQHQSLERKDELARYYAASEDEKKLARHIMERLVKRDKLQDKMLHYWVFPAQDFSGDVVAAARTPSDMLHVLLADGAGHGLSAALNVLPITQPFYAMTESGFGIGSIAAELNKKVRQLLPVDRFVATTLVAVDFSERIIQVWNGGNPVPLLLDEAGKLLDFPISRHVPLGILPQAEFDAAVNSRPFQDACQLVLYSDGVIEAESRARVQFGKERLLAALAGNSPARRGEAVGHALSAHLAGGAISDDTTLVLVDCLPDVGCTMFPAQAPPQVVINDGKAEWQFRVKLGANELGYVDVVPQLLNFVGQIEIAKPHNAKVFLILSELFNNALDHGILRLDSGIKQEPDGFSRYLDMRAQRLAELGDGYVIIELEQVVAQDVAQLRISVTDSGAGFDYRRFQVQDWNSAHPHGRGLGLIKSLCSNLEFHGNGNQVVAYYDLRQPAQALAA
ncbi:MAG: SpoIIE family protein phosphatase [Pseudomonadota bacterium]